MRRAGLDYHEYAGICVHESWPEFREKTGNSRLFGITTKGGQRYSEVRFKADDYLVFGPETRGLPEWLRGELGSELLLRIPMRAESRSLNLANAAAVLAYEAWRQLDFSGGT